MSRREEAKRGRVLIRITMYNQGRGRDVDLENLREEDVDIVDIAHQLACTNRFGGALAYPISVAQHSVMVSRLIPREHALQGLLHDAAEAYVGDVRKWIKDHVGMTWFRLLEEKIHNVIMDKFSLPRELHPLVMEADRLAVRYEMHRSGWTLDASRGPYYGHLTREELELVRRWDNGPQEWSVAESYFHDRFEELHS